MGLDTSHGCWHGAYSAFTRWRNKIAEVAGYTFHKGGYGGNLDIPDIDWGHIPERCFEGDWTGVEAPRDPLIYLIAHSDCDGVIKPEQAAPLADALEALLPKLDGDGGGHVGNYREATQRFVDGLRAAVKAGEEVVFS